MLDTLIENLNTIYSELISKVKPENIKNGIKIFGITGTLPTNCKTFSTLDEMNNSGITEEDTYAIVYGTTYVGTYRMDNGSWTQIGDSVDNQKIMDVLNEITNTEDQYEGEGGTDEEISTVLNNIIGG